MNHTATADAVHASQAAGVAAQFVAVTVDDRKFGIDIMSVAEIRQWTPVTPLPHQPPWNLGVLNMRGAIVPVHDLRCRLGGLPTVPTHTHAVVIASIAGQSVGILVDTVFDILNLRSGEIHPPPPGAGGDVGIINGLVDVAGDTVALLDLNRLFPITA